MHVWSHCLSRRLRGTGRAGHVLATYKRQKIASKLHKCCWWIWVWFTLKSKGGHVIFNVVSGIEMCTLGKWFIPVWAVKESHLFPSCTLLLAPPNSDIGRSNQGYAISTAKSIEPHSRQWGAQTSYAVVLYVDCSWKIKSKSDFDGLFAWNNGWWVQRISGNHNLDYQALYSALCAHKNTLHIHIVWRLEIV